MNGPILFMAIVFWLGETSYFGWNWGPKSDAEMICDGIAFLLLALAFSKS